MRIIIVGVVVMQDSCVHFGSRGGTHGQVADRAGEREPVIRGSHPAAPRAAVPGLVERELAAMVAGTGMSLKIGRVTGIDPRGEVLVERGAAPLGRLVVALGSQVELEGVPAVGGARLHAGGGLRGRAGFAAAGHRHAPRAGWSSSGRADAESRARASWRRLSPGSTVSLLASGDLGGCLSEAGRAHLLAGPSTARRHPREGEGTTAPGRLRRLEERSLAFDACLWAGDSSSRRWCVSPGCP